MDKRKIDIISILSITAIFIIFYSIFLSDNISRYRLLRQQKVSLEDAISRGELIGTLEEEEANVIALGNEIRENEKFLKVENRTSYFLNYISSLARQHKIEIISVEPGETVAEDLLTRTKFTAVLRGRFLDTYNFLYFLENNWRAVKVEALSVDKTSQDRSLNIRLTLALLSIEGYKERT